MIRGFVVGFFKIFSHSFYHVKVEGLDNIPKDGSYILCSNHTHFMDGIAIVVHMKRMIYAIAKEELFKSKFSNWFMRDLGLFPVNRGTGDVGAINTANEHLQNGDLLLIFPEGTRNGLAKGIKFKKGAAYMAIQNNVPIIPIGISGEFKPFKKAYIKIGKPMDISGYVSDEKLDPRKVVELTRKIQDEVIFLRDEK